MPRTHRAARPTPPTPWTIERKGSFALADALYVFTYDVSRDRLRRRIAGLLEENCVRVQRSVFEARMPAAQARRLARQAAHELEPGDSLRVYAITDAGLDRSFAFGPLPLPERQDFYLL